jgi:peptide-methionine (R)-S-oxide reductase
MADTSDDNIDWANLTEAQWRERLTEEEFRILRKEGTERAGTSPLNEEKREGTYVCAGCALPLFSSETKFESGTGWPSFYDTLPGAVETKTDFKLIYPRTEYHCARCGGHQGHVFKDGPQPTGLRYCNNGVALDFVPKAS